MKGVILAGGTGSRLYPLTALVNKHLLPVGRFPMIQHAIIKMKKAGIDDILLVIGKQSAGLYIDYLGGGSMHQVHLTYKIQENAGGIAQALELADGFIQPHEKFVVLLGDNLFSDDLKSFVHSFQNGKSKAKVFLKEVADPRRYGVPIFDGQQIRWIEEKPAQPKSNYCVTGIYMYDSSVFDKIKMISPSKRGEMEITDVNNMFAKNGELTYEILRGWWTDAGTFSSLAQATQQLMNEEDGK